MGTIKCKNQVTIIKKRMAGFDRVETRLVFLPLELGKIEAHSIERKVGIDNEFSYTRRFLSTIEIFLRHI